MFDFRSILMSLLIAAAMLPGGGHSGIASASSRHPISFTALPDDDADARERMIVRNFAAGRHEQALALVDEYLGLWPESPNMHYNRACAFALLGRPDAAGEALLDAVKHGFRDFDTMRRDPDLASMRTHETFTAILEARGRISRDAAGRQAEAWKKRYGERYVQERDAKRKLHVATGLGGRAHAEMMEMIGRQADEQSRNLFPEASLDWCFIVVPAPEDVKEVFKRELDVDDPERTPGVYLHGRRLLVSRDIGSSMRHEFTHRMHWADMEGRGQRHAMWVQEGLAGLYEDYEWRPDGSLVFVPNIRHNIARRQVDAGVDLAFEKLFTLEPESFLAGNARYYPQVRSIFEFLADLDLLSLWYRSYCETFDRDPTGGKAWEKTFGLPLDQVNQRWRRWVRDRGGITDRVGPGDASLGVTGEEAGDGVRISSVSGRQARRAGLRIGDVIMKFDGAAIRSRAELLVAVGACRVGQTVRLEVRRRETVRMVEIRLDAR